MAEGIDWLARHVWIRGGAAVVAWCLTTLIVLCWMPNIQFQFFAKKQWPYAKVAKFLHRQMQKRDVIVSGWNIGFTLAQFFDRPQDQIMLPNDYINRVANHLDAPAPGRVFYVTGQAILNGRKAQVRHFGQLEVTIYRGATARALLQEWSDDLISRTAGRVSAPFETDYQLLALLEEQLSSGQSADHWRSLAERVPRPKSREGGRGSTPLGKSDTSRDISVNWFSTVLPKSIRQRRRFPMQSIPLGPRIRSFQRVRENDQRGLATDKDDGQLVVEPARQLITKLSVTVAAYSMPRLFRLKSPIICKIERIITTPL